MNRIEHHGGTPASPRWWSTTKVPIRDSSGEIMGIAGITRDITLLKRAEDEIRNSTKSWSGASPIAPRNSKRPTANSRPKSPSAARPKQTIRMYQERLRSLASELSLAEERERRRIAVDLHDQIGQTLALIQIKLQAMRETTPDGPRADGLDACVNLIRQPIQDTRSLVFNLSPPVLYDLGLEAAAAWVGGPAPGPQRPAHHV